MKKQLIVHFTAVVLTILAFTGCESPTGGGGGGGNPAVIDIAAIRGVTAPVTGETPVAGIIENTQYSGTVTWNGNPSVFAADAQYTATITLTAKKGFILQGVAANFFTVAGATAANAANSGVITALFPKTGGTTANPTAINAAAIQGVTVPATGATPVRVISENSQYSGTVMWNGNPSAFAANTQYIATITLTAKTGYTLQNVEANFFTVAGAIMVSNNANSGVITALFPMTDSSSVIISAIQGIPIPAKDETPVTDITANEQYSGTVTWSPNHPTFAASTIYTATITLTPKTGSTWQGIPNNYFTVDGAVSVSNAANSGVITAVFPSTDAIAINKAALQGVTVPVNGAIPVTSITVNEQYSGTVTWNGNPSVFAATTQYTATIILTPQPGYTLRGVAADFFTVEGALSVTNNAHSGDITAVFPATAATSITSVSVSITAPVKGAAPSTMADGSGHFTIGTVSWLPPGTSIFLGGTVYTATVTLTANSGYSFTGLNSATINGQNAAIPNNSGSAVTLSYTFPATNTKTVSGIAIKTQPAKLTYTHGDTLDLAGLVVTLTHDDTTTEDVAAADFADSNITANPAHGNNVVYTTHNGQPVKIAYGNLTCNTGNLTVNRLTPTAADFTIGGTGTFTYDGNPKTVTVTPKEGKSSGGITVRYNGSETKPSAAGIYIVTFDVAAAGDFNAVNGLAGGTLTIEKATPTAADFIISGTGTFTYDGNPKTVTVTPQTGKSNGTVTVKYNGSETKPSAVGEYAVTFDVAVGTNYNAASGFSAGTLTITAPPIFTSTAELDTYLKSKPANTTTTPYIVALNVNNSSSGLSNSSYYTSLAAVLRTNNTKYVYLDLSGSTITTIPSNAFYATRPINIGCATLTGITIPDSVTSIEGNAFYECSNLTSITIPNSVTRIAFQAFYKCTSLTAIDVDPANTAYSSESGVLYNKNKTILIQYPAGKIGRTFTIPNSVTSIEGNAFYECSNLTSVTIPNSVTSIEYQTFSGCTSLTSVTIPNSVTSIGDSAFYKCTSLTGVIIPNSVTRIGQNIFSNCTSLASVTIGNSLSIIERCAFYECSNLTSVTIPNSVTIIRESVFEGCSSLTSVTIPNSVIIIGVSVFEGCSSLTSITIPNSVSLIQDKAFYECSNLTSVTIPDSVTSIGFRAFEGTAWFDNQPYGLVYAGKVAYKYKGTMPANTSIQLLDGTSGIAGGAFSGCTSLTGITIPNSVNEIGSYAFYECSNLTSVTIPNSVDAIWGSAFYKCTSLTSITIPNSVSLIGESVFSGCKNLTNVTFEGKILNFPSSAFDGDLRDKFRSSETLGTYKTTAPVNSSSVWVKL